MNLKPFVNDHWLYSEFLEYIREEVTKAEFALLNSDDPKEIYRNQGRVRTLKEFLKLREKVNGK